MNGADLVTEPGADHFAVADPESTAWPHVLGAFRLSIVHQANLSGPSDSHQVALGVAELPDDELA
jgi:hypothetical protein